VIIASLCVAWFELWLMPFRVLDREQQRDIGVEAGMDAENAAERRLTAQALIRQIITNEEELFQTAMEADSSGFFYFIEKSICGNKNARQLGAKH
jgi:hypothetical protein